MKLLNEIQQKLKVPKHNNPMVKYKSRSAEDIVEMVKPLLGDSAILTISDEVVNIGNRYYVKSTATLAMTVSTPSYPDEEISVTAYARESDIPPLSKDGKELMTVAQLSGATSSYARKYALNGLFAIDDTQDDDTIPHEVNTIDNALKNQTRSENDYQEDDFNL